MEYEAFVGERIDKAVAAVQPALSRAYVQQLIEEGHITVSGKQVRAGYKLKKGDRVEVTVPAPTAPEAQSSKRWTARRVQPWF